MADLKGGTDLRVGAVVGMRGNITTLVGIRPGFERDMEKDLGFHEGRLSQGYFILLLRQFLGLDDFKLAGYTYFSGGRLGPPADSADADRLREHLYDKVLQAHGLDGVRAFKDLALKGMAVTGRKRIAKIVPVTRHDDGLTPAEQYPPGRGVPQFELVRERKFLVAVEVTPAGRARTPAFEVDLKAQGYGGRKRLREYMEGA
ncbi:hypothetical protein [Roseospira goensis]|uniref:Uncharacterized protein n=1 Tax=Roseospira goensis TaxID=391922 RepID=A0A7W6WK37_9PROT|nr:hypothetical protein [Roseospira goensis]MBB4285002.1 hypothetical protein [Roseospira goensis]